ncbi:MAG: hypothetical protein ACREMR_02855, partial [Gemmatimonadales bacterium]
STRYRRLMCPAPQVAFGVVDGEPVIVSGGWGSVRVWDARSMSLRLIIPALVEVPAVAIVPDGVAIAAGLSVLVIDVPGLHPDPPPF